MAAELPAADPPSAVAMREANEALLLAVLRQHELTAEAERLNAELRASEERFRMMADNMSQLAWTCDQFGEVNWYNQRWLDYTGLTFEETKGWGWKKCHHPDHVERVVTGVQHSHETGEPWEDTFPLRGTDGRYRWFLSRAFPIRDAAGKVWQWFGTNTDVTDLREMEEKLVARAAQLARADRSKDEFLAMLAHELRNPLAPLRNAAEILQTAGTSAEERAQAQRILGRQIENMSRMIDDLLDVSRITEGKIELQKKPMALEAVLTAATSLLRSNCAARHQELAISMPADPVYLHADATRIEQVFTNLLGNACKYGGEGCHIWLSAERAPGTEPPEVVVRVRDDGIGIERELLPHVFDLFVQASRTLDRSHGGLGIGLTLVQRLVKLHGGAIEAHSAGLGEGSEFIVRLPILREPPPPPPPPLPAPRETPRRILIVDDNTDSARSMATLQTRRGHETRTAFTGQEAVATAAEFLPEVVLLDIGLPGMDGYEVARQLRAMPALRGAFLVAMTGYGGAEDRVEARLAGFDEYLVKPIDLAILREWLRQDPGAER